MGCEIGPKLDQPEELLGAFTTEDPEVEKLVYEASVDWKSYLTFADPADNKVFTNDSLDTVLARRLHDTSISDALDDSLSEVKERHKAAKVGGIVAIMGGHDMLRLEKTGRRKGLYLSVDCDRLAQGDRQDNHRL